MFLFLCASGRSILFYFHFHDTKLPPLPPNQTRIMCVDGGKGLPEKRKTSVVPYSKGTLDIGVD